MHTDFGDLLKRKCRSISGVSSFTRGIIGGGLSKHQPILNTIEFITIASTGNATDFGDLTVADQKW